MAPSISDLLVTDDLTILLGLIAGTVFLLRTFYRPQPLVHPILLGRQSEVAKVRNPGESAVYRNYGTGLMNRVSSCFNIGIFVHLISGCSSFLSGLIKTYRFLLTSFAPTWKPHVLSGTPRWQTCLITHYSCTKRIQITNAALQDRVASFGTGLLRLADLQSQESNVLLLLNDCIGTLLTFTPRKRLNSLLQSSSSLIWRCLRIQYPP